MTTPNQPGAAAADTAPTASPASAWSPFRHRLFAAMWGAQFVSNIGSWMQTVAAQRTGHGVMRATGVTSQPYCGPFIIASM